MARELFEQETQLVATSVGGGNTTTSVSRPNSKPNGIDKVGTAPASILQTRTADEGGGQIGNDLVDAIRNSLIPNNTEVRGTGEIRVNGKYPEVNYVVFNIPNLQSVQSINGNVYSGVIKKTFPVETLPPTDTSTAGTSGTSGTPVVQVYAPPPFGEAGYPGEIREYTPTGQFYIWNVNYGTGIWRPYEAGQSGGAAPTSGEGGAVGFDQSGGGGPLAGNTGFGGGSGGIDPTGAPGGGRPGVLP